MPAELIITLSDGRKLSHALGNRPEVIGRDTDCDIPLEDPSASRRHARFSPTSQGYVVEDLGSKNGTLVNDLPCKVRLLRNADRVRIGSCLVVFKELTASSTGSVVIADEPASSHATRYISREQGLLLSQQRLKMIYELSARLTTLQDQQTLMENAMDICFEMLKFERGAIGVRRKNSRVLDWPIVRNLRGVEGELAISRSLLTRALQHGERAIFTGDGPGSADPTISMIQHGIRSAMCVPLIHQEETLGVIYGDRISTSASYSDEDIDFLAAIAQQVTIGLINCRLHEDRKQMDRINRELELARSIQSRLFPADLPDRPELQIAAINHPGRRISGDYYDVMETRDGRVWCLMADVTGEGVAAALLGAHMQAAVRVTLEQSDDPGILLARWNRLICRNTDPATFITCLLALLDPKTYSISFASAGHCLPIVLRASHNTPRQLDVEHGFPLGVVEEAEYQTASVTIGPEPFVYFCYTDGVVEAMNHEHEMFRLERLLEVLSDVGAVSPRQLVKQVRKAVAAFAGGAEQSDDITMLAARVG